jgi:protein-disulfide isomerase/uncharacterized membrane protein
MKIKLALVFVLAAIGFHLYLTQHYYDLSFGALTSQSICDLGTQFNCSTVSASPFASLLGIPIALWGAVTNFVLAVLLIAWWLGWSDDLARLGRFTLWLSGFVAATSIVMGALSTFFVGSFCIFCLATYLLSFLTFECVRRGQLPSKHAAGHYLRELAGPAKKYLIYLVAIPALTFFFHRTYMMRFGAQQLNSMVASAVGEWQESPVYNFTHAPALTYGPADAKMVLTEFADFRCGHCKSASPSIKAFVRSHKDVRLQFYPFPLDGSCNEVIPGGDGNSCYLAKSVLCAEKISQRGWDLHDTIFEVQDKINSKSSLEFSKQIVEEALTSWGLNVEEHKTCVAAPETDTSIRAMAKEGVGAGVKGTPSFYGNGKKLGRGQLLPVLDAVYDFLQKN